MNKSVCGLDCDCCELRENCSGCFAAGGKPFGGECIIARCCEQKNCTYCEDCAERCALKSKLIAEFNALEIPDMEKISDLNSLKGSYVNLSYPLPSGDNVSFWDDDRIYFGNQVSKKGTDRCYGIVTDGNYLMVSEYGADGEDAEIVIYKKLD